MTAALASSFNKFLSRLILLGSLISGGLAGAPLSAQFLAVGRDIPGVMGGVRLGWTKSSGFVGDHFIVGTAGEVWIVDSLRVWAMPETDGQLGDLFGKLALFGGIESPEAPAGQPECDCHHLVEIRSAGLRRGTDGPEGSGIEVSRLSAGLWQVDFTKLRWSVPGGVPIQFGVSAGLRQGVSYPWYLSAAPAQGARQLRAFDEQGRFVGLLAKLESAPDAGIAINTQVWAHKMAPVSVRSTGALLEVTVPSSPMLDAEGLDVASLRFGPRQAAAISSEMLPKEGRSDLVVRFRRADTGIPPGAPIACLSGREQNGVPFEGCDQIKRP